MGTLMASGLIVGARRELVYAGIVVAFGGKAICIMPEASGIAPWVEVVLFVGTLWYLYRGRPPELSRRVSLLRPAAAALSVRRGRVPLGWAAARGVPLIGGYMTSTLRSFRGMRIDIADPGVKVRWSTWPPAFISEICVRIDTL